MMDGILLIRQGEACVQLNLRGPGLHDPNAGLACILQELHGQILTGEFPRHGNAVDLADRGDEAAEQRAALEQRHETAETRGVARGAKARRDRRR